MKEKVTVTGGALNTIQKYCTEFIRYADLNDFLNTYDDLKKSIHEQLQNQSSLKLKKLPSINFVPSDPIIDENVDSLTNIIGRICRELTFF